MTDNLVTWLRAQLDTDETLARTAFADHNKAVADWVEIWSGAVQVGPGEDVVLTNDSSISRHMVNFDPARVLAEVDAKRRIIAKHALWSDAKYPDSDGGYASALDDVLVLLATAYADRPGYREEWRP